MGEKNRSCVWDQDQVLGLALQDGKFQDEEIVQISFSHWCINIFLNLISCNISLFEKKQKQFLAKNSTNSW